MDENLSRLLGSLIHGQTVAALATLHDGGPFASMIPYATWLDASGSLRFVTHVSRLSSHTRDMLETPRVCLLIIAPDDGSMPQARARVSIPASAAFVDQRHADHDSLAHSYLVRFPQAADWFGLGDFSLVTFAPQAARFVAGFARAMNVSVAELTAAIGGNAAGPS